LLDATKTSFDLCAICFVRGQKMDAIGEVALRSLHGVTGSLQLVIISSWVLII
jgi:hypothetical protein